MTILEEGASLHVLHRKTQLPQTMQFLSLHSLGELRATLAMNTCPLILVYQNSTVSSCIRHATYALMFVLYYNEILTVECSDREER